MIKVRVSVTYTASNLGSSWLFTIAVDYFLAVRLPLVVRVLMLRRLGRPRAISDPHTIEL